MLNGLVPRRLARPFDYIRPSGTLVVWKFDRLARSLTDKDLEMDKTLLANPDITVDRVSARLGAALAILCRYLPRGINALGE